MYCIYPFSFSTKEKLAEFERLSKFDGVMSCVELRKISSLLCSSVLRVLWYPTGVRK